MVHMYSKNDSLFNDSWFPCQGEMIGIMDDVVHGRFQLFGVLAVSFHPLLWFFG